MKISVLMPTRERFELAKESIYSLGNNNDVEILIYVDEDDPQKNLYLNLNNKNIKIFIEKRFGYYEFHKMINFLAEKSSGEWLMLWNDDAYMHTEKWSKIILHEDSSKPLILNFFDPNNNINNLFPIISRCIYEKIGHFSLNTHCDSWVQQIGNSLNIHKPIFGINCVHKREILDDSTKTYSQSAYSITSPAYELMIEERNIDIEKVRSLL